MVKHYSSILETVIKYEQIQLIEVCFAIGVILLTLFIVLIKKYNAFTLVNKVIIISLICILCIITLLYVINWISYEKQLKSDINNQQFITYKGDFRHDNYQKDSFYHNVYLIDDYGNELIVRYPDYGNYYDTYPKDYLLPIGSFDGTVVYSQNSKIIVDWIIDH